jgi:hypothetical protein
MARSQLNEMLRLLLFLAGTVAVCIVSWYAGRLARRRVARRSTRQATDRWEDRWEDDGGVA